MAKMTKTFIIANVSWNGQEKLSDVWLTKLSKHWIISMWVGVCLWANSGILFRQNWVCVRLEAISGTQLWEQEFKLGRQLLAWVWKSKYIHTPVENQWQERIYYFLNRITRTYSYTSTEGVNIPSVGKELTACLK